MKKRITMIFVTLLAAGLCACGSSGQKKAAPEDAGIETKEAGKGSEETAETNGLVVSAISSWQDVSGMRICVQTVSRNSPRSTWSFPLWMWRMCWT